jgi:predicted metal-dependent HD superfamily phosphohydrolase
VADSSLVTKAGPYVEAFMKARKPDWIIFHTFQHAKAVVKACKEIGAASRLSDGDQEVVTLAAWFHDTGYVETVDGHEEKSVRIAESFLRENGFPEEKIGRVAGCIRATKLPQSPKSLPEQVLCDADLAHLARRDFRRVSELIRSEVEHRKGCRLTEIEWLTVNTKFLAGQRYFTDYARTKFGKRIERNLAALKKRLNRAKRQAIASS